MPSQATPYNLVTLEPYTGDDAIRLQTRRYRSPYWCTPKQAWAWRGKAKDGERPVRLHGERHYNVQQLTPLPPALTQVMERHQARMTEQTPGKAQPISAFTVPTPPSLQHFIKAQGGINPHYNHGQWAHELKMIREAGSGLVPGCLNSKAQHTTEELAEMCREAGYILEADVDELLFALSKDVEACTTGDKLGRVYGHGDESYIVALADARYAEQFAD